MEKEDFYLGKEETLLIFSIRIGDKLEMKQLSINEIIEIFMKVRYGEQQVLEEEIQAISDSIRLYRNHLKEKFGILQMFFHDFKFLQFYQ